MAWNECNHVYFLLFSSSRIESGSSRESRRLCGELFDIINCICSLSENVVWDASECMRVYLKHEWQRRTALARAKSNRPATTSNNIMYYNGFQWNCCKCKKAKEKNNQRDFRSTRVFSSSSLTTTTSLLSPFLGLHEWSSVFISFSLARNSISIFHSDF